MHPIGKLSLEMLEKIRDWARRSAMRVVVVFGSRVSGKALESSDVDIAVWPSSMPDPVLRLKWLAELEEIFKLQVDLVIVDRNMSPVLGIEIVRNSLLVFEDKAGGWQSEQLRLWHNYQDTEPLRKLAQKTLDRMAKNFSKV